MNEWLTYPRWSIKSNEWEKNIDKIWPENTLYKGAFDDNNNDRESKTEKVWTTTAIDDDLRAGVGFFFYWLIWFDQQLMFFFCSNDFLVVVLLGAKYGFLVMVLKRNKKNNKTSLKSKMKTNKNEILIRWPFIWSKIKLNVNENKQ